MISIIKHTWSFHMIIKNLAKGSFHKFHMNDHSHMILYINDNIIWIMFIKYRMASSLCVAFFSILLPQSEEV